MYKIIVCPWENVNGVWGNCAYVNSSYNVQFTTVAGGNHLLIMPGLQYAISLVRFLVATLNTGIFGAAVLQHERRRI